MYTIFSLAYEPNDETKINVEFTENQPLQGELALNFTVAWNEFSFRMNGEQFKKLYYKMHQIMCEKFFEKQKPKEKEQVKLCLTASVEKSALKATSLATMQQFLQGLTVEEIGFCKNGSKMETSSVDIGDTSTQNLTGTPSNGNC